MLLGLFSPISMCATKATKFAEDYIAFFNTQYPELMNLIAKAERACRADRFEIFQETLDELAWGDWNYVVPEYVYEIDRNELDTYEIDLLENITEVGKARQEAFDHFELAAECATKYRRWKEAFRELDYGRECLMHAKSLLPESSVTSTHEEGIPGFEAIFVITGLFAVVYLLRRRK